jgi:polysaccharide export outer membrane protein
VFFLLACLVSALADPLEAPDYQIGPGDVLKVEIYGESFGGVFVVGSSGEISFPFCNLVRVGDLTVTETEAALRTCLADGYLVDPQVSVRIDEYKSQRVEVLGAVAKPGLYYLQGETTLRSVIGQAGGIQSEKSTGRVVVTHPNGDRFQVPLDEIEGEGGKLLLSRGDVVSIDEGEVVYVGGEVEKPGAIGFIDGLTVTQALMKAGGPTAVARLRGAYLLRNEERISVNLRRMLRGKDGDFTMQAGDSLVIQESPL